MQTSWNRDTSTEKYLHCNGTKTICQYPSVFQKLLEWDEVRWVGRRERIPVFFRAVNYAEKIYCNESAAAF